MGPDHLPHLDRGDLVAKWWGRCGLSPCDELVATYPQKKKKKLKDSFLHSLGLSHPKTSPSLEIKFRCWGWGVFLFPSKGSRQKKKQWNGT